jgi:hypothetical protein
MISSIVPAAADTRDLVLDRISRCYALADTRQYLECVYGAVQPLRNELGLQQAPQAAAFASIFSRPAPQAAYPSSAPVASAAPAPALAARPQPQSDPGIVSGVFSSVLGMETKRVAPEQFGLRNARPGPGVNVDRITARMAEYGFDRNSGLFTVTLDNGQVWRQQIGDEHKPTWRKPASTYVATISYGANGTFNLSVTGERERYKVQRVR